MNNIERLNALINENNGIVLTKMVTESGIPRMYISELVKNRELERLERGVILQRIALMMKCTFCKRNMLLQFFSHDNA